MFLFFQGVAVALLLAVVAVAANECPSDWTQEQLLVHPDCNKFYKCAYGQPVELDCWGDLFFNINTWECDWPANVDCGDRNIPGQEPETEAPEPETEAPEPETEAPEPETEAPEPETEAPEPETEAPEPETEAPEPETEAPEPETEAPEPETEAPEPETEAPAPETEAPAPETEAPATEAPESDIEFQENGCPVDHSIHWLLPAEDDCNGFYYCVWGEKVRRACPPTLHFNRVIQVSQEIFF